MNSLKYFSFKGKATRMEFFMCLMFIPYVIALPLALLVHLLLSRGFITSFTAGYVPGYVVVFVFVALWILSLWIALATAVRRCHDLCISPIYIFLIFIPMINIVTIFVLSFVKGEESNPADNTKLKQLKRVLRWHLKALAAVVASFVLFLIAVFLIEFFKGLSVLF